jgi:hypothetical protein
MKVLHTFKKRVEIYLNHVENSIAMEKLNLHHFNDKECNKFVDGIVVAKYPEKETPEIMDSYRNAHRSYEVLIEVNLMEDGTLQLA